jgi:putative nucleotidyltransferase with HDIG domain
MIPDSILGGIDNLDPLPVTARRLTEIVGDEKSSIYEMAEIVEYDPAVAANVVRMANSAAFAGRYPIEKVREAVIRLGTGNLVTIVLDGCLKFLKSDAPLFDLSEKEFHQHSAASALMIKALTKEAQCPMPPTASVAALLHDIGKLIMVRYLKADQSEILELCKKKNILFVEAEREVLGCDHAEVGGVIARKWSFPKDVIDAIENHHRVSAERNGIVLDAVMLANYAAKSMGVGLGAAGLNMSMDYAGSRKQLGISIGGFERACAQTAIWLMERNREESSSKPQ